jgi:hypothetical protein
MPDELPGAVVAIAEVWLDDAYDNITLAQACLAARRQQEEEQTAMLGEHPEPPDGGTSAERARRLWITQKLPSPALKEAERSGSYNPGDLNTLTGGTVRNGTMQGHIARRTTRAALSESTQT